MGVMWIDKCPDYHVDYRNNKRRLEQRDETYTLKRGNEGFVRGNERSH